MSVPTMPLDRSGVSDDWHVMTGAVRYNPATGEVLGRLRISVAGLAHLKEATGHTYLRLNRSMTDAQLNAPLEDGGIHFVDVSRRRLRLRVKSACPAILDGLTLKALPLPCKIAITVPLYAPRVYDEAEDSEVDLSFDHPGRYTVRVLSARHTPGVFPVVVP